MVNSTINVFGFSLFASSGTTGGVQFIQKIGWLVSSQTSEEKVNYCGRFPELAGSFFG